MSKYHQAADTLKREAQRYVALNEAAKALDEIGSLDQAATEAKARAIANQKEADDIRAEIFKLKSNADKIRADQAEKLKSAEENHAKAIDAANTEAVAIVDKATRYAEQVVSDAIAKSKAAENEVAGHVAKLESSKAVLTEEVAALQQVAILANSEAEAAEKRLSKVRENINKLATA